jgi:hypothetical protein
MSRLVASIGCLIIITSLTYSTFTQQLLGLALQATGSSDSALQNLPRSETWAPWGATLFDPLSRSYLAIKLTESE